MPGEGRGGAAPAGPGTIRVRDAVPGDAPLILSFIRELAEYEHLLDRVTAEEADIGRYLFRERAAEAIIAEWEGAPAGFALFFRTFSTFLGRPGLYIEDLFVRPAFRGRGLGKALFARAGEIAAERDCGRLEWACLDWNEPSIGFYRRRGGVPLDEWTSWRMGGEALAAMGRKDGP